MSGIVLDAGLVDVEVDGRVLHGTAVPYETVSLVADAKGTGGGVRVYGETWDERSVQLPAGAIPMLASHDESRPIGRIAVGGLWHETDGLHVEASLSGSASEIEGIVARARDRIMAGLSIGFLTGGRDDVWSAPTTPGGVPMVRRRNVLLREVSICVWPALTGATVDRISAHTRANAELVAQLRRERQERHELSQRYLAEHATPPPPRQSPAPPTPATTPARTHPRPFTPDPVSGAPLLPDDPTEHERALHHRALSNWAWDVTSRRH